jgi:hypothetical protein
MGTRVGCRGLPVTLTAVSHAARPRGAGSAGPVAAT